MFLKESEQLNLHTSSLTSSRTHTRKTEDREYSKEFIKNYREQTKGITSSDEFKQLSIDLIMDSLQDGNFGEHKDFLHEIKYFLHYLDRKSVV